MPSWPTRDQSTFVTSAKYVFAVAAAEPGAARGVLNQIVEALRRHPVAEYLGGELAVGNEVV